VDPWPHDSGTWRDNASQVFMDGETAKAVRQGRMGRMGWIRGVIPASNPRDRERLLSEHGCLKQKIPLSSFLDRSGVGV